MKNFLGASPIKNAYFNSEKNASHFIPYRCHWNKNTILTKKNELLQIIKVKGFSFETADDDDLDIRKNMRNLLLKNMASGNIVLYFHTIRKKKAIADLLSTYSFNLSKNTQASFIEYLNKKWSQRYKTLKAYFNEFYVSILYKPDTEGVAMLEHLYKKLKQSSDSSGWEGEMRERADNLEEMSTRVLNTFKEYDSQLLGIKKINGSYYCEMLEFLSSIANGGSSSKVLLPSQNIDTYLPNNRIFFGNKSIEIKDPKGSKYGGIVSILEYGPYTYAGIFDRFLQMPFEFIISQSFVFSNRTVAIQKMQLQQDRMIQAQDKAVSQIAEISRALDMAMSGDIGFGEHHFSLLCTDPDLKNLENTLSMAVVELSNCGLQPVREKINLEPSFWGQLPGNLDYVVRKSTINTLNLASFASMHNYPLGKKDGNHWGEYVTIFNTTSGTPFYFSFHVRDVGHTLIIGPTGAGKTVLMNFLCAQAQKFNPRMYFFDKDRGAEIFIRALNGVYTVIDPGAKCGFNPLALPDTSENRTFLLDWLKVLVTTQGESLTAEDIKLLSLAIDGNYRLKHQDRKLSNIVPFLGMNGPGTLASRIAMWHGNGSHSRVFDNDVDTIDLTKNNIFGFEMAELLKDSLCLSPVLLYVFHRINIALDGYPTMIVLDEAWALIDNPVFAPKIKDWLKVLRKLNTFVIFATQSVEDAAKSQISDTLIQQTATQIFLPNLKATESYISAFMLSKREYNLIKTTDPASRYFLVKQGTSAVIARVNLSGMDNIINVLSGRSDTVNLLNKIRKEHGDDAINWLHIFYEEAKKLSNK